MSQRGWDRRQLLVGAAAWGGVALWPRTARALPAALEGTCPTPTRGAAEGPFHVPGPDRRDLTEGLTGLPLQLVIRLEDRATCTPIPDLLVDVWHADIPGTYSGFASQGSAGETWLRGTQATDADGLARFSTIYPGWYPTRTPHLHVKVLDLAGVELLTTQLYFPDPVSTWIYRNVAPYDLRAPHAVRNPQDGGYRRDMEVAIRRAGAGAQAGITLTV